MAEGWTRKEPSWFVEFDCSMNILSQKWEELNFDGRRYIGVEDVKIFTDVQTNKLLFMGTIKQLKKSHIQI
jgi:hypothetical protein